MKYYIELTNYCYVTYSVVINDSAVIIIVYHNYEQAERKIA